VGMPGRQFPDGRCSWTSHISPACLIAISLSGRAPFRPGRAAAIPNDTAFGFVVLWGVLYMLLILLHPSVYFA